MRQYIVVRIDPQTGIVVTPENELAHRADAQALVFDSLEAAERFCTERLHEEPVSEWWVFEGNTNGKALKRFPTT